MSDIKKSVENFKDYCDNTVKTLEDSVLNINIGNNDYKLLGNSMIKVGSNSRKLTSLGTLSPMSEDSISIEVYNSENIKSINDHFSKEGFRVNSRGGSQLIITAPKLTVEFLDKKVQIIKQLAHSKGENLRNARQNWVKKNKKNKKSIGEDLYADAEKSINDHKKKCEERLNKIVNIFQKKIMR